MQNIQRVIQLAYERALFRFSALAQRTVQDASVSLEKSLMTPGAGGDYRMRQTAHQFLLQHSGRLLTQLDTFFHDYLDRAMQTMYQDLRQDIGSFSAESLSLIDDQTINRNMDVDRLVQRMRDVDQLNHGRLNMMIAQLHDDYEVRERENPFRPYLMARSLYEVLWVMEPEQQVADVLFEHLSNAMVAQLPDYFTAIREVFESNGVEVRLLARPSALNREERLELARQATAQRQASVHGPASGIPRAEDGTLAANLHPHAISQDILASLERVLDAIPKTLPVLPAGASSDEVDLRLLALQNFVSDMLGQSKPHRALPDHDLVSRC